MIGAAFMRILKQRRGSIGKECGELASSRKNRNNLGVVGNKEGNKNMEIQHTDTMSEEPPQDILQTFGVQESLENNHPSPCLH